MSLTWSDGKMSDGDCLQKSYDRSGDLGLKIKSALECATASKCGQPCSRCSQLQNVKDFYAF